MFKFNIGDIVVGIKNTCYITKGFLYTITKIYNTEIVVKGCTNERTKEQKILFIPFVKQYYKIGERVYYVSNNYGSIYANPYIFSPEYNGDPVEGTIISKESGTPFSFAVAWDNQTFNNYCWYDILPASYIKEFYFYLFKNQKNIKERLKNKYNYIYKI